MASILAEYQRFLASLARLPASDNVRRIVDAATALDAGLIQLQQVR